MQGGSENIERWEMSSNAYLENYMVSGPMVRVGTKGRSCGLSMMQQCKAQPPNSRKGRSAENLRFLATPLWQNEVSGAPKTQHLCSTGIQLPLSNFSIWQMPPRFSMYISVRVYTRIPDAMTHPPVHSLLLAIQ